MKLLLKKIKRLILNIFDHFTESYAEVSIGDIVNRRNRIEHNQFLIASRLLDIEDYMEHNKKDFNWQNTISYKTYGQLHREEEGNRKFSSLIESYKKRGYDHNSYITADKNLIIMDGNHRMGMNLYTSVETIKVRVLKRNSKIPEDLRWYVELGLSHSFMEQVVKKFDMIQQKMILEGQTFVCIFENSVSAPDIIKSISLLTNIKRIVNYKLLNSSKMDIPNNGIMIQFMLSTPQYIYKDKKIISICASNIENSIKRRYPDSFIRISKNCLEGSEIFHSVQIIDEMCADKSFYKQG